MGVFSDTRLKDDMRATIASIESIKLDLEAIREAQIVLNKRFSYLDDKLTTALKKKKGE